MSSTTTIKKLHPCQYCKKQCFGKQCSNCHKKMIEKLSGICIDCNQSFPASRNDGTKFTRCSDCFKQYKSTYFSNCITCKKEFNSTLADGRKFEKCLECFKSKLKICKKCNKHFNSNFNICDDCFKTKEQKQPISEDKFLQECKTKNCTNLTTSSLCNNCNKKYIELANQYMISTCQKHDCQYRSYGYFKFCPEHSR